MGASLMRFKIVSTGWECADWIVQTLESIERQTVDNWDVWITYDPSEDEGGKIIADWCESHGPRWNCTINSARKFATRNQCEAIANLDPQPDDVVVFLDLDGDMLAHPHVLERLGEKYAAGALVTYGQYKPIPDKGTSTFARPYPPDVVANNSYRLHHLNFGETYFNHLRTMSGRVFHEIPTSMLKWERTGNVRLPNGQLFSWVAGEWYQGGTDYLFMICALELAGGRFHCFDEVLLLYNHANPRADNKTHPHETDACLRNFFARPPLAPLGLVETEIIMAPAPASDPYLSAEERRLVLREYGRRFGLKVFIETGTNDGGTPMALKDDFVRLVTIELGEKSWREAVEKFKPYPKVFCLQGDSAVVLPGVLADTTEPALIWLDGHFSGGDTARGSQDTPVLDELQAIFSTGVPHVVLVDDARLFEGMPLHDEQPNWPGIDEVRKLAEANGYQFEVFDDIVRLIPGQAPHG